MYFLANDPRVPEEVRTEAARWGLAKDEFTDNGGWPHQLYVREARRMVGALRDDGARLPRPRETPDSVGMGSYTHGLAQRAALRHARGARAERGGHRRGPAAALPDRLRALTPKKAQCENLLVPVCLSASHIAYGSIRMEPVFMILGQSAATAAALAIDDGLAVQDLPYETLRERLLADGQVLELPRSGRARCAGARRDRGR